MPLTAPKLDDLDYAAIASLMEERIPLVAPEWTDHNASDPGIALIRLFAHLSEQLGYRLNRVPEKSYVEFLKLVGIQLAPARAAQTQMVFLYAKPAEADAVLIPQASRITGKGAGGSAPVFETDAPLDAIPAQLAALVTARDGLLSVNAPGEAGPQAVGQDPDSYVAERYRLVWDGKEPKLKDMPLKPVRLFQGPDDASHTTLYLGLAFNQSPTAGFYGARATLHLQLDEDEQPLPEDQVEAGAVPLLIANAFDQGPPLVGYEYYRPPLGGVGTGTWQPLPILSDTTDSWTRSGALRFDVPARMGPVPLGEWAEVEPGLPHPLIDALKTPRRDTPAEAPVSGWIRVRFGIPPRIAVRSLAFNSVVASNLTTVEGERLGRGTGLPGQSMAMTESDVAPGSLTLVSQDQTRAPEVLTWNPVPDFDSAGPDDPVYVLDAEAGVVLFGDGLRGRPPASTELMIATRYRHGGGPDGAVPTGGVAAPASLPAQIETAFNVTPARGGAAAETLEEAKARAPREFRRRGRAVTGPDFVDAALSAPGVLLGRAHVVPLRRPYPAGHQIAGLDAPGLDLEQEAPGALSVIVVPDQPSKPYPMPTTSELTKVAAHLDTLRLLTTELHVTTPQYVRIHDLRVTVKPEHGYSETVLKEAVRDRLGTAFHVLTGGPAGTGYPFGLALHHADLVAEVMRVPGVARVEGLDAAFDGFPPETAEVDFAWRVERRIPARLTNCPRPEFASDTDRIVLAADEVPFVDPTSIVVSAVGWP